MLVTVAERNIKKYNIVPLYYNMKKANSVQLDNHTLYEGMTKAYTGGNIGIYSNNISKIWNLFEVETRDMSEEEKNTIHKRNIEKLNIIKLLCMENNFVIDYAKTLYKPERPDEINELISSYTSLPLPHFFKYAKDKTDKQISEPNGSLVNRLETIIRNPKLRFKASNVGEFDYRRLMNNPNTLVDDNIINRYNEIAQNKKKMFKREKENRREERVNKETYIDNHIRKIFTKEFGDVVYITDVLIKFLYETKRANKNILWDSFGHVIVGNLKINVPDNTKQCETCGARFEVTNNRGIYCSSCAKEQIRKRDKERKKMNKKS